MTGGCAGIRQALAHRFPMLLLDRVVEVAAGDRLTALKAVTGNEPWYQDLPDGAGDDYPAVLVVESWCQAAAVLAGHKSPRLAAQAGLVPLFGALSAAVLTGRVRPGDVLVHQVRQIRAVEDTVIFEGESLVGGTAVLTVARLVIAWRPAAGIAAAAAATPAGQPVVRDRTRLGTGHA
jgi:3-hydroxyacyl-[acyl-carrier-protein] dehydratase